MYVTLLVNICIITTFKVFIWNRRTLLRLGFNQQGAVLICYLVIAK